MSVSLDLEGRAVHDDSHDHALGLSMADRPGPSGRAVPDGSSSRNSVASTKAADDDFSGRAATSNLSDRLTKSLDRHANHD